MDRIITAAIVVFGVPAVLIGYIWATEQVLRVVPQRARGRVRPWLWLAPALVLLFVFLVYPTIQTIILSFQNRYGTAWVGTRNYEWFFTAGPGLSALLNNIIWLVCLTVFTLVVGLAVAVLADGVRYERIAKTIFFMPLAISGVAAALIWKFMYAYQPPGAPQTGTLNAVVTAVGISPVPWLTVDTFRLNTFCLILVMTWLWTGFGMVIISAAYKGIPVELVEAARVDGATEAQVFRRITLPLLAPTLAVVATTMIITALKAFDVVYTMTNGAYNSQVIANEMINELFTANQQGRASAIAVILLLAIVPIMLFNIRRFQAQEAIR
ncbi:MAG TPA: sugar ABC transporter permease [Candidatus Limnocylindrales bacterium]